MSCINHTNQEVAVVKCLSSCLAEQRDRGLNPGLTATISGIGYLLLPSGDMAEIPLKQCKSSIKPTNQHLTIKAGDIGDLNISTLFLIFWMSLEDLHGLFCINM